MLAGRRHAIRVAKEQFTYPETQSLFKAIETLRQRSGVSRGQAFEDFLTAVVCALAAETKEEEYLSMVERHKKGRKGQRGIDLIPQMFGELVYAMDKTDADILGDLFQGAITYGENGLYLTPDAVTSLMAKLTVDPDARPEDGAIQYVSDCCCGTGRMLLEAAKINPEAELVGQDIDARCANISAINLGLRGKYGWVVCGNALSGETQFAYRIGHFYHEAPNGLRRGVIRDVRPADTPVPVIADRLRQSAGSLFDQVEESPEPPPAGELPQIIEVPRWIARLEKATAKLEEREPQPAEKSAPIAKPCDDPPPTQKHLF